MVYKFCSTSKVSFPGSGVAAIAASDANLVAIRKQMQIQTIGHDKLNQLRHARFYKDIHGMVEHMKLHADILRPKFETVLTILERELEGLEIGSWLRPRGGYFISFDAMDGCAKAIVAKASEAGLVMTPAGRHSRMVKIQKTAISVLHRPSRQLMNLHRQQKSSYSV